MRTITQSEFINHLSNEFFKVKGFGVYAFLSYSDIAKLYDAFCKTTNTAKQFTKLIVKEFI